MLSTSCRRSLAYLSKMRFSAEILRNIQFHRKECMDIEPKLNKLPIPPGDVMGTYADVSKAKKLLSYDPQISFRSGVEKEIEWFKEISSRL